MFGSLQVNHVHQCGKNTNMSNPVTFKAEQHGSTLANGKYAINWFCSQLPLSIVIIKEVYIQLVSTDEQTPLEQATSY